MTSGVESKMASTYVRIIDDGVARCRRCGFKLQIGRGQHRHFLSFRDNPFDPSSSMYDIPIDLVGEVTVRATVSDDIMPGLYEFTGTRAEMRVSRHVISSRTSKQQGYFSVVSEVPQVHESKLEIRIRAETIQLAKDIFTDACNKRIVPITEVSDQVMSLLD